MFIFGRRMTEYIIIGIFTLLGTVFVGGALITSKLISYKSPDVGDKHEPYECGEKIIGPAHIQFNVGYYLFALLFLIFDIESLFLFPAMRIFKDAVNGVIVGLSTQVLFVEVFVFITILLLGLAFAWRKGVLKWE